MGWFFSGSHSHNEQKTEIVSLDQLKIGDYVRRIEYGYEVKDFREVTSIQKIGTLNTQINYGYGQIFLLNREKFERLL